MLRNWADLPEQMRIAEVKPYYDILDRKRAALLIKRILDVLMAFVLIVVLALPMVLIGLLIKLDGSGPVFFRQERVTEYGKVFRIHKFRTMAVAKENTGNLITVGDDPRITNIGKTLRRMRLDELPQLIDVLQGNMSFVGTRPEALEYVSKYKPEYLATLLLPAGITSEASIRFKDEGELLKETDNVEKTYLEEILPDKMELNLKALREFSIVSDARTLVNTVWAVIGSLL
jgi:lipopolysaccharide/colanic/teichoic acid biosynthesis glycosyltransferase